jgi:hypothetical protein
MTAHHPRYVDQSAFLVRSEKKNSFQPGLWSFGLLYCAVEKVETTVLEELIASNFSVQAIVPPKCW